MRMHKHIPEQTEGGHTNAASFSNSKTSNVIFVTHTATSEAVLDEAFAQLNIEVFTDINMSKRLLKEIARERHHTIETTEYIYF